MKNVLIIGGSYFAGRVLVEQLVMSQEHNVYVYNRGNVPLNIRGVQELVGDRNVSMNIKEVIPDIKWDALIDFCAYVPSDVENILDSLPGSLNHYILISTATVYESSTALPITEDSPKLSSFQPELGEYADYGYNKWLTECKLKEICERKGIRHTSLRPAIIYGRYNYAPRETYFFDLIEDNKPIFLPDNVLALFSFVLVEDMAKIIIQCISNKEVYNRAFNLCAEEFVSYPRLIEIFEEICGKKLTVMHLTPEEIISERIALPFPFDRHLIYSGTLIGHSLRFEYTPIIEGMRTTYEYYRTMQKYRKK